MSSQAHGWPPPMPMRGQLCPRPSQQLLVHSYAALHLSLAVVVGVCSHHHPRPQARTGRASEPQPQPQHWAQTNRTPSVGHSNRTTSRA
eukprot:1705244-Rhodomonas_salina.2